MNIYGCFFCKKSSLKILFFLKFFLWSLEFLKKTRQKFFFFSQKKKKKKKKMGIAWNLIFKMDWQPCTSKYTKIINIIFFTYMFYWFFTFTLTLHAIRSLFHILLPFSLHLQSENVLLIF